MAHKKGQGSSRNGRDSNGQRRGIKVYEGQTIRSGGIILRQVGAVHKKGTNVGYGRDWTIYSYIDGVVKFESGQRVSVYPAAVAAAKAVNKEPPADHLKPAQPARNGFTPETKGQSKPPQNRPRQGR